jgi:hypothetical protein
MKQPVLNAFSLLISLVLAQPAQGQDVESSMQKDICETRPDLCGGAPAPRKKKQAKRSPTSASASSMAAARAAANADREMEFEIEGEFDESSIEPMPKPERETSNKPLRVTFESYMQSNAAHPAIARRPASMLMNQKAFVPPVVRATITGSTLDQPAGATASPPATNAPVNPSGSPDGPLR